MNILEVSHVRDLAELDLSQTSVDLVLETGGADHIAQLTAELAAAGYEVTESS